MMSVAPTLEPRRATDTAAALEAPPARASTAAPRGHRWARKLHLVVGLICTLNFAVLLVSGFLIQHREALGLEQKTISRAWLPSGYRPDDPDIAVRADIALTDLHSGRLWGRHGTLVVDAVSVGWFLMIASGLAILWFRKMKLGNGPACGNGHNEGDG